MIGPVCQNFSVDECTDGEVMEKKQTNFCYRMALEKEEKKAEMKVRKKDEALLGGGEEGFFVDGRRDRR